MSVRRRDEVFDKAAALSDTGKGAGAAMRP